MSLATMPRKRTMTIEEFLALPDDGVERMLLDDVLWEEGDEMTRRSKYHAGTEARVAKILGNWLDTRPEPRGEVSSGEAGFILSEKPRCVVGIDVAVVPPDVADAETESRMYIGAPTLAVEILSPYTSNEARRAKLKSYLKYGVPVVWSIDPEEHTVTVYKPGADPVMFNRSHGISGEPELPGFQCAVADLFR